MVENIFLVNYHWNDINPVDCGHEKCIPDHSFGPTTRFYWLLHYVVKGKGIFTVGEKSYPVQPGQIFIIRPFEVTFYQADSQSPWEYIWIGFTEKIGLPECLQREYVVNASRYGNIFVEMLEAKKMEKGRELYICGKIYQLLACLTDNRKENEEGYVERARTYLESNYMRKISIIELAEKMNLNRSYFSTIFRTRTGKSPQQYLTDYRMEKSCELMIEYDYSPGEAALLTGYPDIFSFSRMFKKHFGISPREYIKESIKKDNKKSAAGISCHGSR